MIKKWKQKNMTECDKMKKVYNILAGFLERNKPLRSLGVDWRISEWVQGKLAGFCKHINFNKR
jgi:hypothetical protein